MTATANPQAERTQIDDDEPIATVASRGVASPDSILGDFHRHAGGKTSTATASPLVTPRQSNLSKVRAQQEAQQVKLRSRHLTFSLFMLAGAISSLAPFLALHLTNRVGFLLFESDLLQLRSSLITNLTCLFMLVILGLIIIIIARHSSSSSSLLVVKTSGHLISNQQNLHDWRFGGKRKYLLLQKILKYSASSLAIISILSYLALALIVPHIKQIQRQPYATFDCNANLIIIENCQQQFTTSHQHFKSSALPHDYIDQYGGGQQQSATLIDILRQLLAGDLNGNNGRLSHKLECLKYNEESYDRLRVPTRFLLNKCGLVCEPQWQQLHQFGDDLNWDLSRPASDDQETRAGLRSHLVPPYSQPDFVATDGLNLSGPVETMDDEFTTPSSSHKQPGPKLIPLKLCFSGEIDGANSNYKRFCIENLTSGNGQPRPVLIGASNAPRNHQPQIHPDQTLTVGQLNAILSRVHVEPSFENGKLSTLVSSQPSQSEQAQPTAPPVSGTLPLSTRIDQSTHYVNPIVQFESHFKNWPHLARAPASDQQSAYFHEHPETSETNDSKRSWCKLKPIPPFIVNNRPFSDIHCSFEHDYLMSTSGRADHLQTRAVPALNRQAQNLFRAEQGKRWRRRRRQSSSSPKIYLKKSNSTADDSSGLTHNERCNIQCKVNMLYQVLLGGSSNRRDSTIVDSFYLPMKYCLIVSSESDKLRSSNYYLFFRSLADASLLLAFVLIDLQLLIESRDTRQFQLGEKKVRLLGLLLAITLPPLLVGVLFDATASWIPSQTATGSLRGQQRDGYLINWLNEWLIPSVSEILERLATRLGLMPGTSGRGSSERAAMPNNSRPINQDQSSNVLAADRQELVVDNYLVPFIIYAMLMFAFAISTFRLPLVALVGPLVEVSSIEELGMVEKANVATAARQLESKREVVNFKELIREKISSLKRSVSPTSATESAPRMSDDRKQALVAKRAHQRKNEDPRTRTSLIAFALISLFMGLQFNLSQITQTQILLESFNLQNNLKQQQQLQQPQRHQPIKQQQQQQQGFQSFQSNQVQERANQVAIWFVLASSSSGVLLFVVAILFRNELAQFLNDFYPFKVLPKINGNLSKQHELGQFHKLLAISLAAYALRYFVLANMVGQSSRMKLFLVILFQSTEMLNFPLTWFVLTQRAHQLLLGRVQSPARSARNKTNESVSKPDGYETSSTSAMSLHLVIECALAFVFFALARFLALFTHSFHASLYLHSDDIDWFVESFYDGKAADRKMNHASSNRTVTAPPESLFLPLPNERQTYVHASRSFVKYNSIICLITATILVAIFLYHKYQAYSEQLRLDRAMKRVKSAHSDSEMIDEQLSLDLARIHAKPSSAKDSQRLVLVDDGGGARVVTEHIPRAQPGRSDEEKDEDEKKIEPTNENDSLGTLSRAKVHFRYGFGQRRATSLSSSSSSGSYSVQHPSDQRVTSHGKRGGVGEAWRRMPHSDSRFGMSTTTTTKATTTSSSSSSAKDISKAAVDDEQRQQQQQREDSSETVKRGSPGAGAEGEQITLTRTRRIQMVTDDEDWSLGDGWETHNARRWRRPPSPPSDHQRQDSRDRARENELMEPPLQHLSMATSPPPPGFADDFEHTMLPPVGFAGDGGQETSVQLAAERQTTGMGRPLARSEQRKRQISFAPLTTFIDQDGAHSTERHNSEGGRRLVQRANDEHDGDDDDIVGLDGEFGGREVGLHHEESFNISTDERRHLQTRLLIASPEPSIDDEDE